MASEASYCLFSESFGSFKQEPKWAVISKEAQQILNTMHRIGVRLVTAESCTGGMLATVLTDIPGASQVVEGGFVTYSNAMKQSVLGVKTTTLHHYGAVSAQTVQEMAEGALYVAERASFALAISGIAGPDGATPEKPVGLVWFGIALRPPLRQQQTIADAQIFKGERVDIRTQAVCYAIKLIATHL